METEHCYFTQPPHFTRQTSVDVPKLLESSLHRLTFRNIQSLYIVCEKNTIKVLIM